MPTPRSTTFRIAMFRIEMPALAALCIGSVIAALLPFDLAFAFLTRGSVVLRALALPVIGLAGLFAARRVGVRFGSTNLAHPVAVPVLVAALVALGVAILDGLLCRGLLTDSHVQPRSCNRCSRTFSRGSKAAARICRLAFTMVG